MPWLGVPAALALDAEEGEEPAPLPDRGEPPGGRDVPLPALRWCRGDEFWPASGSWY